MKRAREVLWAAVAERDLLRIVKYIAEEDARAAVKILNRIKAGTAKLDHGSERGRVVPEFLKHGISRYREIVIRPWRVIYRIEGEKVCVLAVIDGRRNVEDVLLERLLE
jgi:plasmid stabilization system protein ParE